MVDKDTASSIDLASGFDRTTMVLSMAERGMGVKEEIARGLINALVVGASWVIGRRERHYWWGRRRRYWLAGRMTFATHAAHAPPRRTFTAPIAINVFICFTLGRG